MTPARWAAVMALAFALYFAIQGGEYGTTDLLQLRQEVRQEEALVARLEVVVDSLQRAAKAIQLDPRTQERVAREAFGMIRQGEHLFRIVPGDTARRLEDGGVAR
ncbi:MAG TPA: septum formation initiator family protein [Gemmatimonadales bacterium]|nr:septum formation initiator family protein [Gemmatimonadales bacterium]